MLKIYKNILFSLIKKAKLSADLFEISEKDNYFRLTLHGTNLFFDITNGPHSYYFFKYLYAPLSPINLKAGAGGRLLVGFGNDKKYDSSFDTVEDYFFKWLTHDIKDYLEEQSAPDFWSGVATIGIAFGPGSFYEQDFDPFSLEERTQVKESIERFKLL